MKPENGVKCTVSITEDDISRAYLLLAWRGLARLDGCLLTVAILSGYGIEAHGNMQIHCNPNWPL